MKTHDIYSYRLALLLTGITLVLLAGCKKDDFDPSTVFMTYFTSDFSSSTGWTLTGTSGSGGTGSASISGGILSLDAHQSGTPGSAGATIVLPELSGDATVSSIEVDFDVIRCYSGSQAMPLSWTLDLDGIRYRGVYRAKSVIDGKHTASEHCNMLAAFIDGNVLDTYMTSDAGDVNKFWFSVSASQIDNFASIHAEVDNLKIRIR